MIEAPDAVQLGERLRHHAAQLKAIADQLDGLGLGDPDLLRRGEEEMRALLADAGPDATQENEDPEVKLNGLEELQTILEKGLALLEDHRSRSQQTEERWSDLQDRAVKSARAVPRPSLTGQRYPDYGSLETRVDVRF